MPSLIAATFLGFCGYAVLLPVAPLWAVHGGADPAGAGLVNGVLLLFTVITQLFVPAALRHYGWGPVMVVGMVLLGVPAVLYGLSDTLISILILSAIRGVGFGVLTVTGSAAVAHLVAPGRRGEAIGAYGLGIAMPQLVLLPLGPWVAEHVGFTVLFVISALPLIGIPPALRLARAIPDHAIAVLEFGSEQDEPAPIEQDEPAPIEQDEPAPSEQQPTAYRRLMRPMLLLLPVTLAGGAVITFAPQMVSSALVTTLGLFVLGLVSTLTRWWAGIVADRHGAERFIWPLVLVTVLGMILVAWSVTDTSQTRVWTFFGGMVVVGLAYGALQNLTLVVSFDVVSRAHHNLASAVWNIGFDLGTGLGSVVVGIIAVQASFSVGMLAAAAVSVAVIPLALLRRRG